MEPDWKFVILRTARGALMRPLMLCDITPEYEHGMNDPEVLQFLECGPQSRSDLETWVRDRWEATDDIAFGIYIDHRAIGNIRLHDLKEPMATVGICIYDKSRWGEGWAPDAISRVVKFASEQLGISDIKADMKRGNAASVAAFKKAGFRQIEDGEGGKHQTRWSKRTAR
jgi:RimJ/RimL family protein N-acetyltransferase